MCGNNNPIFILRALPIGLMTIFGISKAECREQSSWCHVITDIILKCNNQ